MVVVVSSDATTGDNEFVVAKKRVVSRGVVVAPRRRGRLYRGA